MDAESGIRCRPVEIESPSAISVGETYHAPLRSTILKLQETYGIKSLSGKVTTETPGGPGRPRKIQKKHTRPVTVDDEYQPGISVMCMDSTVGPEGICPSLLVFGKMPELPLPGSLPAALRHAQRMMMMDTARDKYNRLVGKNEAENCRESIHAISS